MESTRTRWAKPNRRKVQDSIARKMKVKDPLTRKKQMSLKEALRTYNREYEITSTLKDKLSSIDENYGNFGYISRLDEFAIVNICDSERDEMNSRISYIHGEDGVYYAIDIQSGEIYHLSMEQCRGKFKQILDKCYHTWQTFFEPDDDMLEQENKVAYYDTPVTYALLHSEDENDFLTSHITMKEATQDIMNYIVVTNGLVNLNMDTTKLYYKK